MNANRQTAFDIYLALRSSGYFGQQSRKVRWLAARHFAGVDSAEQIAALSNRQPIRNFDMPGDLTVSQAAVIIKAKALYLKGGV